MEPIDSSGKPASMQPADLHERLRRARLELDAGPASHTGRLPVWVAAACLGAGLLAAPACGKKEQDPVPPPGLETALMKPAEMAMEPELEGTDPMDPLPGQIDPPPGSMAPIPPPTRGAEKPEDPLAGGGVVAGSAGLNLTGGGPGVGSLGPLSGGGGGSGGLTYGAPPMSADKPTVREGALNNYNGKIDAAQLRRVIIAHRGEANYCYEKALQKNPRLAGTVRLKFEIGKGGIVGSCTVVENLSDPTVGDCLCARVKTWRFPEPEEGSVQVNYPWTFVAPAP